MSDSALLAYVACFSMLLRYEASRVGAGLGEGDRCEDWYGVRRAQHYVRMYVACFSMLLRYDASTACRGNRQAEILPLMQEQGLGQQELHPRNLPDGGVVVAGRGLRQQLSEWVGASELLQLWFEWCGGGEFRWISHQEYERLQQELATLGEEQMQAAEDYSEAKMSLEADLAQALDQLEEKVETYNALQQRLDDRLAQEPLAAAEALNVQHPSPCFGNMLPP